MPGFGSREIWNDGEGILEDDLELGPDLVARRFVDEFLFSAAGAPQTSRERSYRDELRPHRNALMPLANTADMNVAIHAGPALAVVSGTQQLDDTATAPEHLFSYTPELSVTIAAADPTQFRRDLIQARIVATNEPLELRHFEDATTGAKTTQNLLKRVNAVIEVGTKSGGLFASAALADVISAEPAPDAGWFRLASIQVPPAVTALDQRNMWDWRMPMGFGCATQLPQNMAAEDIVCWSIKNFAFQQLIANCQARIHAVHTDRQIGAAADGGFYRYDQRRIANILLAYRLNPTLDYANVGHADVNSTAFTTTFDALSRITAGAFNATANLYRAQDIGAGAGVEDPPLWANGLRSPAANPGNGFSNQPSASELALDLRGSATVGTDQVIYSMRTNSWGGF